MPGQPACDDAGCLVEAFPHGAGDLAPGSTNGATILQTALGILLAALAIGHLARKLWRKRGETAERHALLFSDVAGLLQNARLQPRPAPDLPTLTGFFEGLPVQLRPVVDTLATRKLPSLWLQITLPVSVEVAGTFDFMMRPAGVTTFSNFDHLPHIVASPDGLPRDGLVRSDDPDHLPPADALAPAFPLFADPRMKEFLVSPKGVRIVVQIGEADRAQYAVFRQAEFATTRIDPNLVRDILSRLAAVMENLRQTSEIAA